MNQLPNKYSFTISFLYNDKRLSYQVNVEKLSPYRESFTVLGKNQNLIFEGSRPAKRHSQSTDDDWLLRLTKGVCSKDDFKQLLELSIRKQVKKLESQPSKEENDFE